MRSSPGRRRLFDTLLPKLALDLDRPAPPDLRTLFDGAGEVRLESGFGGGEHLIAEAERNPETGFIGIEPFINGMAKALAAIDDRGLTNIRLHHGDATDVLAWLPNAVLRASTCSIRTRGRNGAIGNDVLSSRTASRRSPVSCGAAANSGS